MTVEDRDAYGYTDIGMLPLSQERAVELFAGDMTVYLLYEDNTEAMALDAEDIPSHGGIFGVPYEEWEQSHDFDAAIQDRLNHQEQRESAFLQRDTDAFAIYQLKEGDELRDIRFEGLDWLQSKGAAVKRENYDLAYTAPLPAGDGLDALWDRFNNDHPADYHRPSLSVSDIVAIKQGGVVSCHYVDSFSFVELPGFLSGKNPLRAVEDSMEQNDNQLDGLINNAPTVAELEAQVKAGQTISLQDLAHAVQRERGEKKKSVLEQLKKQQPQQERKKAAPSKGAEMEI